MKMPKLKQHMIVEMSDGRIGMIFKINNVKSVVYDNCEGWDLLSELLDEIILIREIRSEVDFCLHKSAPVIWKKEY